MDADEKILDRIKDGVAGFSEDRHRTLAKLTQSWGKDTSATDKALRNCLLGTALSVIEGMRIKPREQMDAMTEVASAAFSGYALGRELLGTETARPSYSSSEAEEKDNALRIHDRSHAWEVDALTRTFQSSETLVRVIHSQAYSAVFSDIVGAKQGRATLQNQIVGSVAFAMAEEDLFGPFTPDDS